MYYQQLYDLRRIQRCRAAENQVNSRGYSDPSCILTIPDGTSSEGGCPVNQVAGNIRDSDVRPVCKSVDGNATRICFTQWIWPDISLVETDFTRSCITFK